MIDFVLKSAVLLTLRIGLFLAVIFALGGDPNNDTAIFTYLAEKDFIEHIYGDGRYSQYPKFLPVLLSIFHFLFGEHWFRVLVIVADLAIFSILYWSVKGFRGSVFEKIYLLGAFTAPLTAVWAQDEVLAVVPLVFLFVFNLNMYVIILVSLISFLTLKNFYLFVPFSLACSEKKIISMMIAIFAFLGFYILDHTGSFVPGNVFTTSIWYFSGAGFEDQKLISTVIFSACAAASFLFCRIYSIEWKVAFVLIISLFCQVFYHVNFEYFVFLTIPTLILFFANSVRLRTVLLALVWFVAAVSTNLFYALGYTVAEIELARHVHALSIGLTFVAGLFFIAALVLDALRDREPKRIRDVLMGEI